MGSVVLNELTASWRPTFCTTKDLFTFTHVQQADSLARTLVNAGEIDGAPSARRRVAGGFARPVVQAPIAVRRLRDRLHHRRRRPSSGARASTSTPAWSPSCSRSSYPADAGGARQPPEHRRQPAQHHPGPGVPGAQPRPAGRPRPSRPPPRCRSSRPSSDLVWALTSWIDADPEARAWLDGDARPVGDDGQRELPATSSCRSTTGRCSTTSWRRSGTRTRTPATPTARRRSCS